MRTQNLAQINEKLKVVFGGAGKVKIPSAEDIEAMSPEELAELKEQLARGYRNTSVAGAVGGLGRFTENQGYRSAGYAQDSITSYAINKGTGILGAGVKMLGKKIEKKYGVNFAARLAYKDNPFADKMGGVSSKDPALIGAVKDLTNKISTEKTQAHSDSSLGKIDETLKEIKKTVSTEKQQYRVLEQLELVNKKQDEIQKTVKSIDDLYVENSLDKLEREKEASMATDHEKAKVSLVDAVEKPAGAMEKAADKLETAANALSIVEDIATLFGMRKGGGGAARAGKGLLGRLIGGAGNVLGKIGSRAGLGMLARGAFTAVRMASPVGLGLTALSLGGSYLMDKYKERKAVSEASTINTGKASKTVADAIDSASEKVGVDKAMMYAVARKESGFNPNAKNPNSSAGGLYQFIDATWNDMVRKYGDQFPELQNGRYDVNAAAIAGALYAKENGEYLQKAGIQPTADNIYATHFLGPDGARKFLSAPGEAPAEQYVSPGVVKANSSIFDGRSVDEVKKILFGSVAKDASQLKSMFDAGIQPVEATSYDPNKLIKNEKRSEGVPYRSDKPVNRMVDFDKSMKFMENINTTKGVKEKPKAVPQPKAAVAQVLEQSSARAHVAKSPTPKPQPIQMPIPSPNGGFSFGMPINTPQQGNVPSNPRSPDSPARAAQTRELKI